MWLAYADVGSAPNLDKDDVPTLDQIHKLTPPTKQGRLQHIKLVEIKYCRDSNINQQLSKATTQNQHLKQQMEQQHQCKIIPILLGVSGSIYTTHTAKALSQLGVSSSLQKTTMRKLHTHAVQSLGSIVSTRSKERKRQAARRPRRRQHRGAGSQQPHRPARDRYDG